MDHTSPSLTARQLLGRWVFGVVLALGALLLVLRPGGITKVLALVLAGGAVAMFTRRNPADATVVIVVLLLVAGGYLLAFLTGNSHWITERY